MLRYVITRLLLMLPTLLVITVLAFFLKSCSPGDPIAAIVGYDAEEQFRSDDNYKRISYELTASELYMDKPLFYFSFAPSSLPRAYFSEPFPLKKEWIKKLSRQCGHGAAALQLVEGTEDLGEVELLEDYIRPVLYEADLKVLSESLSQAAGVSDLEEGVAKNTYRLDSLARKLEASPTRYRNFIPVVYWFGLENQYHHWLVQLVNGRFGISLSSGRPVDDLIREAAWWTLWMNGAALFFIVVIGLPLGVWLAARGGKFLPEVFTGAVYLFYAVPLFWLATMAVVFFTTDDYGQWSNIFPSVGSYTLPSDAGLMERLSVLTGVLGLPVACIVLSNLAYISVQMRNNMEEELGKKYVLLARSKGLNRIGIIWKHAFPNAMYSMITVLGGAIPALISGSIVIEVIFNINGMGRLLWNALFTQDWPVVFAVVLLAAFFTVIGQFLVDMAYVLLDPRVRFEKGNA